MSYNRLQLEIVSSLVALSKALISLQRRNVIDEDEAFRSVVNGCLGGCNGQYKITVQVMDLLATAFVAGYIMPAPDLELWANQE